MMPGGTAGSIARRPHYKANPGRLEVTVCRIIDHFTVMAWQIIHKNLVWDYLTHDM